MATITNNSRAIRTINVRVDGRVKALAIAPGESVEGDPVETPSFQAAVKGGRLSVKASAAPAESPKVDDMTVEELKAHLTDKGVQFASDAKKADLLELAKK